MDASLAQSQPLTEYVASHPSAVWFVGPFFAAVTGVAFKEGVCYGKPECAVLFFITPALLLGGPSQSLETLFVCEQSGYWPASNYVLRQPGKANHCC